MEESFWQARWHSNQIGFHLDEVNPWLLRHWRALALPADAQVLVPLCGKSLDLLWLADQGHRVLGVELAEKAVLDFFAEWGVEPEVSEVGALRRFSAGRVEILQGDFFALTPEDTRDCVALYDRAAIIALPPAMREAYVAHLARLLAPGCRGLMVTLEYEQSRLDGPPFSVPEEEVRTRLESDWRVELLEREDVLEKNWKFASRGLDALHEPVFRLQRKG